MMIEMTAYFLVLTFIETAVFAVHGLQSVAELDEISRIRARAMRKEQIARVSAILVQCSTN